MTSVADDQSALAGADASSTGAVPVESLSPPVLEQLLAALQQEVEQLASALQQLNFANQRWMLCKQSIEEFEHQFSHPVGVRHEEVVSPVGASVESPTMATPDSVAVTAETPGQAGRVLVPLSGSLFVYGQIKDPDRCLIDIGTGYHAERSLADAKGFFEKRLTLLRENIRRLMVTLDERQGHMETIQQVLLRKLAVMQHSKEQT